MAEIPKHVHCCEKLSQCKWQCFVLHKGLSWGKIEDHTSKWREWHAKECGGKLIQFDLVESKGGDQ